MFVVSVNYLPNKNSAYWFFHYNLYYFEIIEALDIPYIKEYKLNPQQSVFCGFCIIYKKK